MADQDRIDGYTTALFEVARAEGTLDEVEDELFRFKQNLEGSDELRAALTDQLIPVDRRQAIVEQLLGGKATTTTTQLVSFVVGSGRARDLPAIIDRLVARAAASKDRVVAEVRSAVELSQDQKDRLAAALANATGKQVAIKVVIDPSLLGGLIAQVGDTVIDGSIRSRIDQLKTRL
ncbi:MAG: ATP synthase F1 subunit delta [Acidimicrobiia bacterium]